MQPLNPMNVANVFKAWNAPITLIGCGGMGSRIAEVIARMALNAPPTTLDLTLIDFDSYEEKNLRNQFMTTRQIGEKKVNGLAQQLLSINQHLKLTLIDQKLEGRRVFSGVLFLCVDSMHSRRLIMQHCIEWSPELLCVIDPRLDSGVGVSYCFDPQSTKHCEAWWMHWHPDAEAENYAGCGGSTPIPSAVLGTAALAMKQFEHFLTHGSAQGIINRVYQDFDCYHLESDVWPT